MTMTLQDQDGRPFSFGPFRKRTTFLGCYHTESGRVDFSKLSDHIRGKAKETKARMRSCDETLNGNPIPTSDKGCAKKRKSTRLLYARRRENGELEAIPPDESGWYQVYTTCPMLDNPKFHHNFRRRFITPYLQYLQLVEEAVANVWFPRWTKPSGCCGTPPSPLELLILGSLRYLGRGYTFDDCEESTAIDAEVHRVFFHQVSSKICLLCTTIFDVFFQIDV